MEVKKKQGKTKIDRDINEYLRKKNINTKNLFNNNNISAINSNGYDYNAQMLNNSLLAMNYLLLQNQLLMQQNNASMDNQINNNIIPQNNNEIIGDNNYNFINFGQSTDKIQENPESEKERNPKENFNNNVNEENMINFSNDNLNQNKEIIKQKILEAINRQNNNNVNIINDKGDKNCDPRKKGGK